MKNINWIRLYQTEKIYQADYEIEATSDRTKEKEDFIN